MIIEATRVEMTNFTDEELEHLEQAVEGFGNDCETKDD